MDGPARCLVLMCGLPAAGKTAAAARLHAHLGGTLIRSCDVFRVLYELAARRQAEPVLIVCRCDDVEETRCRIEARRGRGHIPEHEACDVSVYEDIARRWHPPGADEGRTVTLVVVDTQRGYVTARNEASPATAWIAEALRAVVAP